MEVVAKEAISKSGGVVRLARELQISPQAVCKWKRVPAERVLAVSRASGIPCHVLRPDIFESPTPQPAEAAHG